MTGKACARCRRRSAHEHCPFEWCPEIHPVSLLPMMRRLKAISDEREGR